MKTGGLFLRIIGGALLILAMLSQTQFFRIEALQKYTYLMLAVGLLLYVLGLCFMKSSNSGQRAD